MWFLFTLFTIIAWGGSDLFSKMGSKPDDKFSHWKMVMAVGLVMGVHAIIQITVGGVDYSFQNILVYLPVSLLYIISMVLGYAGLRYIELSVSSPICNSSGAITAILCYLVLKQSMTGLQLVAVVLVCLGVFGLAFLERKIAAQSRVKLPEMEERKYTKSFISILFPILYCLIDGVASFTDAYYLESVMESELAANISYEFTFLLVGLIAFIYVVLIKKERISLPKEKSKLAGALCETAGQFTYVFAMADNAIVAAPTIASYSIVSILLSRIFLKEKLTWKHYSVIAVVMAGIAILGIE